MKKITHSPHFRPLLILWGATAVSCLFVFRYFLFGDYLVVFNDAASDTRQQYLMQYATIANHLRDGNLSLWDMNIGFGASVFALNLFNVFLAPVYLGGAVLGSGHIPSLLLYMTIAQIFLAGTFCYLFLNEFSVSAPGRVIASYLYAFNGYLIIWGQHYQFGSFVVLLPLLLFLLERAVRRKKCSLAAPFLVAVMICSSVYMSYMALILAGLYILWRAILEDGRPAVRVRLFLTHCGELLLGIGIGGVIFLPMVRFLLTVSTRLDSSKPLLERLISYCSLFPATFYRTALFRFFSTAFEGLQQYKGYSNLYEAPALFFSALFVILALQYLFTIHRQDSSKKAKLLQYLAVLLLVFFLFVRLGSSIFNAFAYPFSRHTFIFMPLFALVTAKMFDQTVLRRGVSLPALFLAAALIVYVHMTAFHQMPEPELRSSVLLMGALALAMALLLLLVRFLGENRLRLRRTIAALLFLCVMADASWEAKLCYNKRNLLTTSDAGYWGGLYDPDVTAALSYLREADSSLYRVEKDYYSGSFCMDGLAQGYRGISAYNSTPNRNIEEFVNLVIRNFPIMARYEYTFRQIGYYTGHSTLFGIKYLLSKNPSLALDGFRKINQFGGISLYQNEDVSSFARFYTKAGDSSVLSQAYGKADLETMLLDVALLDVGEASGDRESGEMDTGSGTVADNTNNKEASSKNLLSSLIREITGTEAYSADELLADYALEEITKLKKINANGSSDAVHIPIDQKALADYEHIYLEFDIKTPEVSDITVNIDDPLEYHFRTESGKTKHVQIPVPASYEEVELSRYGGMLSGKIFNLRLLGSKHAPAQEQPQSEDAYAMSGSNAESTAAQAEIHVPDTSNDSRISGTVSAKTGGFLFLPIPYEDGWSATVDGEAAEILRTDVGFVSIPMTAGEHSFCFTYHQPWMRAGFFLSVLSLALWLVLLALHFISGIRTAKEASSPVS